MDQRDRGSRYTRAHAITRSTPKRDLIPATQMQCAECESVPQQLATAITGAAAASVRGQLGWRGEARQVRATIRIAVAHVLGSCVSGVVALILSYTATRPGLLSCVAECSRSL